jgi:hypothetical protein
MELLKREVPLDDSYLWVQFVQAVKNRSESLTVWTLEITEHNDCER